MEAMDRAVALLQPSRRPADRATPQGYLDLLGDDDPTGRLPGQRLMVSSALPVIYERLWRPLGGRLLMGALGPSMDDERQIAIEMLELSPGDTVLDVGCGPGNFTRAFAAEVGDGLAVGLDASRTMLAQGAAREERSPIVGRASTGQVFSRPGATSPTSAATLRTSPSAPDRSTPCAASPRSTSSSGR